MRRLSPLAAIAVAVALALPAPRALAAQAGAPAPAGSNVTPAAGQLAAARELLRIMDIERVTISGAEAMLDAQFANNPALAPYVDVMRAWTRKYLTWDVLGERMTRIYAAAFTEAELRDLIAFYKTPTGRKLAQLTPELTRRGSEVGAQVAQEHMGDLQRMLEAREAELQQQKKP